MGDSSDLLGIKAFVPVLLDVIRTTDRLPFHLYVKHPERGFVPFRFQGTPFQDRDRHQLLTQRIRHVYVDVRHHERYCQYVEGQLDMIVADGSIDIVERARLLYQVADRLVEGMATELSVDNLNLARKLVRILASNTLHSRVLPEAMATVAARERHAGAHMLHVSAGALRLGMAMKLPLNQLGELALGGLLHDVGKPPEAFGALESPDHPPPLDEQVYREHPRIGAERLREACPKSEGIIAMVAQHHEQLDGKGFPESLTGEKIHRWGKICAVVNEYDILVAGRSGHGALSPHAALKKIEAEVGQRFDPDVFNSFKQQLDLPPEQADPSAQSSAVTQFLQQGPVGPHGRERRKHPRFPFHITLMIRRSGTGASRGRGQILVEGMDISCGDIHFISERPLGIAEDIFIDLPVHAGNRQGPTKEVRARVVRCRRSSLNTGYDIAAKFVEVSGASPSNK